MAAEILVVTPAIRALIRDDKIHQIYSAMQSGKKFGMQTMNDALYQLYMSREVAQDECVRVSQRSEGVPAHDRGHAAGRSGHGQRRSAAGSNRDPRASPVTGTGAAAAPTTRERSQCHCSTYTARNAATARSRRVRSTSSRKDEVSA